MTTGVITTNWLALIRWNSDGLVPVIAQDYQSGKVLMLAWMNTVSLSETVDTGYAVYFSRSRQKLWRKGESSGHAQRVVSLRLDCDEDVILLKVEQNGGIACHTGREGCFFRELVDNEWQVVEPVLRDPELIYQKAGNTSDSK